MKFCNHDFFWGPGEKMDQAAKASGDTASPPSATAARDAMGQTNSREDAADFFNAANMGPPPGLGAPGALQRAQDVHRTQRDG